MSHAPTSLWELGSGEGLHEIRAAPGVTASGIDALVLPAGHEGFLR